MHPVRLTIAEAIAKAAERLAAHRIPDARLDAELLLRQVIDRDRAWLVAHYPDELPAGALDAYERLVDRRAAREPLQYITGSQEFRGLAFTVTPDVLIPRPETEFVVEAAVTAAAGMQSPLIIDLCTGSGCIAVSLAAELPGARIFATDRSRAALDVAMQNARTNGVAERIRFVEGDLFGPLEEMDLRERIDIITANPPYIRSSEMPTLQPEVRDFEPRMALLSGPEGTEIAERILEAAPAYLKPGGSLVMEMGIGQADALRKAVEAAGRYGHRSIMKDLAGIERVLVALTK